MRKIKKFILFVVCAVSLILPANQQCFAASSDTSQVTETRMKGQVLVNGDQLRKRFEEQDRVHREKEENQSDDSYEIEEDDTPLSGQSEGPFGIAEEDLLEYIEQVVTLFAIGAIILLLKHLWKKKYIETFLKD